MKWIIGNLIIAVEWRKNVQGNTALSRQVTARVEQEREAHQQQALQQPGFYR